VACLINVCAWLASLFPERAQADIWASNPDAWIAGSLAPNGETVAVDGGWRVSGRWPWASGSMHAQWAACGIHMKNERGEMTNLGLSLMPIEDLTVEDTWFMAGMKGTGSNTIVAKDVFVPEHRFLPYPQAFGGTIGRSTPTKSCIAPRSCRSPSSSWRRLSSAWPVSARARDRQIDIARHHAYELHQASRLRRVPDADRRSGDEDRHGVSPCAARGGRSRSFAQQNR
jgi:hypothetical protein